VTVIAKDLWEKLSQEDQQAIMAASEETSQWLAEETEAQHDRAVEALEEKGATVTTLSPAEIEKWRSRLPDVFGEAAKELDKAGAPGTEFVERTVELAREIAADSGN
jgi:TRAP-type C4-dicarboxylate transport system substrate-binding protein